jgi:hypothetical protein
MMSAGRPVSRRRTIRTVWKLRRNIADQIVAVTSAQRMTDLEEALKTLKQRRTAVEVFRLVER